LEYLLFAAYLVLFAWLVTRIKFFTRSGLSNPQLIILFLLKVMAGIFYGWMGIYYGTTAQMLDTWVHHQNGMMEYQLLKEDPSLYFTNLFRNPYNDGMSKFFASSDSYWNDLKGNMFAKILSVFDIFTFGKYYVNVIFYSFLTLFGPIALFRVMTDAFPRQKSAVLIATFLVPSFLYWCSGLHKEGALALGVSLIIYHLYFGSKERRWPPGRILCMVLGLLLMLTLRNFVLMIVLPAMAAWLLANCFRRYGLLIYILFYGICIVLFFNLRYLDQRLDFPQAVVDKQNSFSLIVGKTSVPVDHLQPTARSFIQNTPQAFSLSILRPYPSDVNHILSLAASVEIILIWLLLALFILYRKRQQTPSNFLWFIGFLSLTFLLSIGFSVNNLGAIARYRSIMFPVFITPLAAMIDWSRVQGLIFRNIKK